MPTGFPVPMHRGFDGYCEKHPDDCVLPDSKESFENLHQTFLLAKELVKPLAESEDVWTALPESGTGDCEDFALTLRKLLRNRFPDHMGSFRMVTAFTERGDYHAALSIETQKGTIICDIRFDSCRPWWDFRYTWHLRESVGSRYWQDISYAANS